MEEDKRGQYESGSGSDSEGKRAAGFEAVVPQSQAQADGPGARGHAAQALCDPDGNVLLRLDPAVRPVSWDEVESRLESRNSEDRGVPERYGGERPLGRLDAEP